MQFVNVVKTAVLAVSVIWLVGCASQEGKTRGAAENDRAMVEMDPIMESSTKSVGSAGRKGEASDQKDSLLNQKTFNFGFDSSQLGKGAYLALDAQAAYLNSKAGGNKKIIIQGHTDERGTRTYNLALGERRANSVKNYLVAKGVAAYRIEVISFGFEKPIKLEHNEKSWAINRRAVIIVD